MTPLRPSFAAPFLITLLLLSSPAFGNPLSTEGTRSTRIEFTAYEREKDNGITGTNVTVFLSGGYGRPDMDALNRYMDYINANFAGTVSHLNHYSQMGFGVEWKGPKSLFAGMAFQWIDTSVKGSTVFAGQSSSFRIDIDAGGLEIYGGLRTSRILGPLRLEALLGAGYYRSRYRERENGYDISGKDWAPGFRGGLGFMFSFSEHLSFHVNGSYRYLKFDDYNGGNGRVRFVSPGHPAAEADFSGFMLEGRMALLF